MPEGPIAVLSSAPRGGDRPLAESGERRGRRPGVLRAISTGAVGILGSMPSCRRALLRSTLNLPAEAGNRLPAHERLCRTLLARVGSAVNLRTRAQRFGVLAAGLLCSVSLSSAAMLGRTDTDTLPPPSSGPFAYDAFGPTASNFPGIGQTFVDPIFRTTIKRLTNIFPATNMSGSGIIYSQNGLWNADGTLYLHNSPGQVDVIDLTGGVYRANVPYATDTSFDPVNPFVYYYIKQKATNTNRGRIMEHDVRTGNDKILKEFPVRLGTVGSPGSDWIDNSGRYFLLNVAGNLRIWDKQSDVLYEGSVPVIEDKRNVDQGIPPGWASISPDAKYVIVSLNPKHLSYIIDHPAKRLNTQGTMFWDGCYDHGDVLTASDGKTYMITAGCRYDYFGVYRVDVRLTQVGRGKLQLQDNVRLFERGRRADGHYSCGSRGTNRDWCYVSTHHEDDQIGSSGIWAPYKQEIVMVQAVHPFEVRRLVHHRSRPVQGYCRTPRPNTNWDGTKLVFTSNFGQLGNGIACGYSDLYLIDVGPAGSEPHDSAG
jgi:hypothetical protein